MTGHEDVDVTLPDGSRTKRRTALCCQSVCFFTITGVQVLLQSLHKRLPEHLILDLQNDTLTFILLRYFTPHPSAFERDTQYRPVCPGPLRLNHCLWTFSKSTRYRLSMCNEDGTMNDSFERQRHVFGVTEQQQRKCFEDEKKAYFGVLTPRSIKRECNMTPEFCGDNKIEFSGVWIETVTLI